MTQPESRRSTLLIVDDNITNLKVAMQELKAHGFQILTARNGEAGIERAQLTQPDLVLLDVQMPGIDGFETCRRLKADRRTSDIPVIFMSVLNMVDDKLKGFAAGAVDYVLKPFEIQEVLARVNAHLTIYRLQRELQAEIHERKRVEAEVRRQHAYLTTLHQIALELLNRRDVGDLLQTIVDRATELLDAPYGLLVLIEDDDCLVPHAATQNQAYLLGIRDSLGEARLTRQAYEARQPAVLDDYSSWPHRRAIFDRVPTYAVVAIPIVADETCLGVLNLSRDVPGYTFDQEEIQTAVLFGNLAALVLDNARLFAETQKAAISDGLTGLANRRHFDGVLEDEWKRARREGTSLALIMIDVDSFKRYNDTYGHQAGDECLRQVASVLASTARRAMDLAARYGGEEFALILPNTSLAGAAQRAEELRSRIEALHLPHQTSQTSAWVTLSAGVAALIPAQDATPAELIALADQALYHAKQSGRNCIHLHATSARAV
jgi:diguanylate cyclase (GGDEF)-like protein